MKELKKQIINDPIYGFISLHGDLVYELIEHPYFQRLRNIRQLGMGHYVYPGAIHTRFHHALGAMHLMQESLQQLKLKGVRISAKEEEASLIAILLHDIGHGPFSHALERTLVKGVTHEEIGKKFFNSLNKKFKNRLSLAIRIFEDKYERPFFHELVSSQLDMDRLDYLMRDSFFTGVNEGIVSTERIIKMLNVREINGKEHLVVEQKGIYSIEKFLVARRLMYWQVYLHKTVLSAEMMLIHILLRAKSLIKKGNRLFTTPALLPFLEKEITLKDFDKEETLELFSRLDDTDIYACLKAWQNTEDPVLRYLSYGMVNRRLFRLILTNQSFSQKDIEHKKKQVQQYLLKNKIPQDLCNWFFYHDSVNNRAYHLYKSNIRILKNNGEIEDVTKASDLLNLKELSKIVTKHFIAYPKEAEQG